MQTIAGFPAEQRLFSHRDFEIPYFTVPDLAALVDRERLLRDDVVPEPPYWAHVWIGAAAVARWILDSPSEIRNRRVLDLGCGLGLPGLAAARLGATVTFADLSPEAIAFARASSLRIGAVEARFTSIDFTCDRLDERFDVILAAEIVYEPKAYEPLAEFLDAHLDEGGTVLVTDAFRSDAQLFFQALAAKGFEITRQRRREWEEGVLHGLFLCVVRRGNAV